MFCGVNILKREKSCGALVFLKHGNNIEKVLLIRHRHGGHWSFPKGHVEGNETETETALREVKEETGKDIVLIPGFREKVDYSPKPNVEKEVVYFISTTDDDKVKIQEEEISQYCWMEVDKAYRSVSFMNDKNLLSKAMDFFNRKADL